MRGWMYILECSDGSYYTGSTNNIELRSVQHQSGEGANHTKKRLPVKLIYYEDFQRIDEAFYREKQVQGWSRKKKEALINGSFDLLPTLAIAYRDLNNGGFEHFENLNALSHRNHPLPEALEGNTNTNTLEGNTNTNTLEGNTNTNTLEGNTNTNSSVSFKISKKSKPK